MTPPKKINVGLIGFGLSGRYFHAPFLAVHPGFNVTHVMSSRPSEVTAFDPEIIPVATVDELLADDRIELVFICSPNETHFRYAQAALERNKHVVVEKPFALTETEAQQLLTLAASRRLLITAYQNRRWDADFLTVKQLIADNRLGDVLDYEARYDRFMPVDTRSASWKELPGEGRGSLFNLGPHLIDQALHLFGNPQNISAEIRSIRPNSQIDDWFTIRLGYSDKVITLKSSLMAHQNHRRFTIHGTAGSFTKGGLDVQEPSLKLGTLPNTPNWGTEPIENRGLLTTNDKSKRVDSLPGNYAAYYEWLYESVANGAELAVKPLEILATTRVIDLARQSNREGRTLSF
ncbi:Gfo/Idh/MocA family oxidoreductase [Fibrella sp. USSR17]